MRPRIWPTLHAGLTVAALGCCAWLLWKDQRPPEPPPRRPEPHALPADEALRSFFDVQSIAGYYELPEGENFGLFAVLGFEDGKFVGRKARWQVTGWMAGTRVVSYQLLWGRGPDGKARFVRFTATPREWGGGPGPVRVADFFAKLDGSSDTALGPTWTEEIRGYRILAYKASKKVRPGQSEETFGSALKMIETRQTVAVLGVKTFPTHEEAMRAWETRE